MADGISRGVVRTYQFRLTYIYEIGIILDFKCSNINLKCK